MLGAVARVRPFFPADDVDSIRDGLFRKDIICCFGQLVDVVELPRRKDEANLLRELLHEEGHEQQVVLLRRVKGLHVSKELGRFPVAKTIQGQKSYLLLFIRELVGLEQLLLEGSILSGSWGRVQESLHRCSRLAAQGGDNVVELCCVVGDLPQRKLSLDGMKPCPRLICPKFWDFDRNSGYVADFLGHDGKFGGKKIHVGNSPIVGGKTLVIMKSTS